jgi:hypothetical protein
MTPPLRAQPPPVERTGAGPGPHYRIEASAVPSCDVPIGPGGRVPMVLGRSCPP